MSTVPFGLLFIPLILDALYLATNAIRHVAFAFVFGQPFFLGAGIFLTTKEVRQALIDSSSEKTELKGFFQQFAVFIVFLMVYVAAFSISVLLITAVLAGSNATIIFVSIPGVAVAALIMTLFLSPIAALFAMVFDDWKLTALAGAALCYVIVRATGYPIYTLTFGEVALLGPVYYFMALAVILSGIEFESPAAMAYNFGMYFELSALIIPTIVFTLVSVLSFFGTMMVFSHNRDRWFLEEAERSALFELSPGQTERLEIRKHGLKIRRSVAGVILILFLIIVPVSVGNYTMARTSGYYMLAYESKSEGDSIETGQWFNVSFVGRGPPDLHRMPLCYCWIRILEWDNASQLRFECYLLAMTLDEFQTLNDTEIMQKGDGQSEVLTLKDNRSHVHFKLTAGLDYVVALRLLDLEERVEPESITIFVTVESWI